MRFCATRTGTTLVLGALLLFAVATRVGAEDADTEALKAKAEKGDAVAQNQMGMTCLLGSEFASAVKWYRRSAEQGNVEGQTQLGKLLLGRSATKKGQSVEANPEDAFEMFLRAANQGYGPAQFEAARCLERGCGTQEDYVEAYKWYELAVRNKYEQAKLQRTRLAAKMFGGQIDEGRKLADSFKPERELPSASKSASARSAKANPKSPPSADPGDKKALDKKALMERLQSRIQLKGLSGSANHRLALINNLSLFPGEAGTVVIDGHPFSVQCLEIREHSVVVSINSAPEKELFLQDGLPRK